MITSARVEALRDGRVRLRCTLAQGCGPCREGGGCALRWVGKPPDGLLELPLHRLDPPPRSGEEVELFVAETSLLAALAWLFMPPSLGLLLGALLGQVLGGGDAWVLATSATGLAAGGLVARWRRSEPVVSLQRAAAHARPTA